MRCISFDSYIKPQPRWHWLLALPVVYLLIPTSNHNLVFCNTICIELYIFWFLHQTTTIRCIGLQVPRCISFDSYIKPQLILWCLSLRLVVYLLIPTSNHNLACCCLFHVLLYIFWFLHQTTTCIILTLQIWRCISFDSYIKPQLLLNLNFSLSVVYLLIPTSNHNVEDGLTRQEKVVYLLIPTSNHNLWCFRFCWYSLYIFWFLHQTTTVSDTYTEFIGCISFDSYIKPQRCLVMVIFLSVVYLLIPTSNHNYYYISSIGCFVVYLLIPTSNHNFLVILLNLLMLYIFWFLHQTTTVYYLINLVCRCISFDSYIKPQHSAKVPNFWKVVYLLIPTSNHNQASSASIYKMLYIFWFLHQTTTALKHSKVSKELYIFWFLHQTTTFVM